MCLCSILQYLESISVTNCTNCIHICTAPLQMDCNDGLRLTRNFFFYFHRINIKRLNNWFYKNRGSPCIRNSQRRGDISIRRNNDLIACTDAPSSKHKIKRIKTCSYTNTIFCTTISCKFILELLQLLSLNKPATIHYTVISSI